MQPDTVSRPQVIPSNVLNMLGRSFEALKPIEFVAKGLKRGIETLRRRLHDGTGSSPVFSAFCTGRNLIMVLAVLAYNLVPEPALAKDHWTCSCNPSLPQYNGFCTCTGYTREIAGLGTRYFWGTCEPKQEPGGKAIFPDMKQTGGKGIACSSNTFAQDHDDPAKYSCTNFGFVKSTLSMQISCIVSLN